VCDFLRIGVGRECFGNDLTGIFARADDSTETIVLNSGLLYVDMRWTWAHEIGHSIITVEPVSVDHRPTWDEEQLCNEFARHLLVPSEVLRAECIRLGHPKQNRIGTLAELFGVTRDVVRDRLRDIGMHRVTAPPPARREALRDFKYGYVGGK
jgi:Zn-dependent peptidase ImmA (M78 family)